MPTYLRQTLFRPGEDPVTAVIEERDLKFEIHMSANETRNLFGKTVDVEIFDHPGDLVSATVEAQKRSRARVQKEEMDVWILRDWAIAMFQLATPTGVVSTIRPVPLPAEQVQEILKEVMKHPTYQQQRIIVVAELNVAVIGENGKTRMIPAY